MDDVNKSITSTSNYQKSQTFLVIKMVLIGDPNPYYLFIIGFSSSKNSQEIKVQPLRNIKSCCCFLFPTIFKNRLSYQPLQPGNFEPFVISSSCFKKNSNVTLTTDLLLAQQTALVNWT